MKLASTLASVLLLGALAASASAATVDGTLDAQYGPPLSVQQTQTQFGNASDGVLTYANGSELDNAYAVLDNGTLYLFFGGNLESNFNKLDVFIDAMPGGQGTLRGDNRDVDFNGLNRMAGLTFDTGFEPELWFSMTNGGDPHAIYANYAQLLTDGGPGLFGGYLGSSQAGLGGLSGGDNPYAIEATLNNSNTAGVDGGCEASSGAGVTTGMEIAIPLPVLVDPSPCIKIAVFVNGSGHDYLSNQVLGALLPSQCNLGEPSAVNFNQYAGEQFFTYCTGATPTRNTTWGRVKTLYR
jgi:hypothetical protein